MTLTTEPNSAIGAVHMTHCPQCGSSTFVGCARAWCTHPCLRDAIARDTRHPHPRGVNSRLGPDAGNPSTQSTPETSGLAGKSSSRKISGFEPWGGCW
jgi:hypothetical protein